MSVLKCKICGGNLNVKYGDKIAECEYCGTIQTVQTFSEPKIQDIYNRAAVYLAHNEFDKAENLYNQIIIMDNTAADAYWNILMCRYGVAYISDPETNEHVPTCNRTIVEPIFNDENYINAIKYATEEQSAYFVKTATQIDNMQKEIIKISKREKPFDIFISYKETNENGSRTNDSVVAQELYFKLTEAGYKCFFSRITLENKVGSEYEPIIYAALASSKVLLLVGSSKQNMNAVWVRNEWSRFLAFAKKDNNKTLLPLYFDMPKSDIPVELENVEAYNIKTNGAIAELIRGIKKIIPLPVMLLEKKKKRLKIVKTVSAFMACVFVMIGIAFIPWFAKLPDYNRAMELFYNSRYPEAAWAFDKLGGYRDSLSMKKNCELSWRKSLAVPVTTLMEGAPSSMTLGYNYINENGEVSSLTDSFNQNENSTNNHGKIISLTENNKDILLYEDGYITNVPDNISNRDEWNNIIKVSKNIAQTTVALKADGTMIYGDLSEKEKGFYKHISNSWIEPITTWKNIVSFFSLLPDEWVYGTDNSNKACILGLTNKKTVQIVESTGFSFELDLDQAKEYVKTVISNYDTVLSGMLCDANSLMFWNCGDYRLENDGNLYDNNTNVKLLQDIVFCGDYYAVSKNGRLYDVFETAESGKSVSFKNIVVVTYSEWGASKIYGEWSESN